MTETTSTTPQAAPERESVREEIAFAPCLWGCKAQITTQKVPGSDLAFPDLSRLVVHCRHARIKGDKRLVLGAEDHRKLAQQWNARTADGAGEREAIPEGYAVLPLKATFEMIDHVDEMLIGDAAAIWEEMAGIALAEAPSPIGGASMPAVGEAQARGVLADTLSLRGFDEAARGVENGSIEPMLLACLDAMLRFAALANRTPDSGGECQP